MWSHLAPAEDIIVVSEIGEQWSPQTAPAIHAEIEIIMISLLVLPANTLSTIGIRIPNVPQEVPVANESPTAIRKTIAGRKFCKPEAELWIKSAINTLAPIESVMIFRVQAQTKIIIAGTIALKPSGIESRHALKLKTLRQI